MIRTALIIGAGVAGPATAMALHKAGIVPTVYEAHPDGADGIGIFLTVASNGMDALRVLGADKPVLAAGFPTPRITLRSGTGKRLGTTRTGQVLPDGTVSQTITRAGLYQALYRETADRGIRIEYGKRLVAAENLDDGVRAVFADGSEATAEVLIGCDGVGSTIRRIIDPAAPAPAYAGLLTTGGYARGVRVSSDPGSYEMIFGRHAFFGYAVAPSKDVWWFANLARGNEPGHGELAAVSGEDWRRRLLALFAGDAGPAAELIRASPEVMPASPIHTMPHLAVWHRRRMIVIGDAAHAPSPTSGQGASLSVEDAIMLAACLRDLPTPQAAFTEFTAARRPRVEKIIKWAARINTNKIPGPAGRTIRDVLLPPIMKLTADSKSLRQTFDYHLDWDTRAVLSGLQQQEQR
jgi:2-polyprenyl-6-methoxyphenol hydroxylase-like FAD-dependent oxidoreductase